MTIEDLSMKTTQSTKDLSREVPIDQLWVKCPEFEKALYDASAPLPEVKRLTEPPFFHWFSYYDKLQLDNSMRFALSMEVDFEHRSPKPSDSIRLGMVDTHDNNKWIPLGTSNAWCWQQGCMLQWRPSHREQVIWNDREKDKLVTRILNVSTGDKVTIDYPVYHVHPNGKIALGIDFHRLQFMRPGYSYSGLNDPNHDKLTPQESSVHIIDLDTGRKKPLINCQKIAGLPYPDRHPDDDKHYFNCPTWSPDGSRFLFLNRWRSISDRFPDFRTRMFTADPDGEDIRLVTNQEGVSHYAWFGNDQIALWRQGAYRLYKDDESFEEEVILEATNGHLSFLPDKKWMIGDTYVDQEGYQNPFLLNLSSGKIHPLGHFHTPSKYKGEWRCDLHPRVSQDGKKIIVDSVHEGLGRQLYMFDIESIISG